MSLDGALSSSGRQRGLALVCNGARHEARGHHLARANRMLPLPSAHQLMSTVLRF